MPLPSVTLHGGPFADGRRCRICFPQSGNRGGRRWLEMKPDVRRVFRGFGELFGGLCVVLLLLPDFEYISGDEPSAQLARSVMQDVRTGYRPDFGVRASIPSTAEHYPVA